MSSSGGWPITFEDVLKARERLGPHLSPTPLRSYPVLDVSVGARVLVKHENFQPTGAFKVRNALSALTTLDPDARRRGVVAATRGNHGLGLAWAGERLGIPVTVCVPLGNNPEKNSAIRALGARLVEDGQDYDDSAAVADRLVEKEGLTLVHSTNNPAIIAGAGTMALEILDQDPSVDACVVSVGGGSQAVGTLTVARELKPDLPVYAVQAAGAAAIHDAWHRGEPVSLPEARTFADGLATRNTYPFTFDALRTGLRGFVTATDGEIAEAVRLLLSTTHTLAEGAGAASLAGLMKLRDRLAGKTVAIILSGGNIDTETLRRVLAREL